VLLGREKVHESSPGCVVDDAVSLAGSEVDEGIGIFDEAAFADGENGGEADTWLGVFERRAQFRSDRF
jgi:hypothetical protein